MAKLLLVEDDNNLREIYEARLQAEGYTIVSARDGEEALVVAKAEKPDLIISDVMMPKISGFEMLDILRNTEELKNVKVIMLTALGQSDDQQRADKLGADRYLVKSQVTLEDIIKVTHELLGDQAQPAADAPAATAAPAPAAPPVTPVAPPDSTAAPAPVAPAPVPETPTAPPVPEATPEKPATPAAPPSAPANTAQAEAEVKAAEPAAKEEADVEAKIEDFVVGASSDPTGPPAPKEGAAPATTESATPPTSAPPLTPSPQPEPPKDAASVTDDKLMADAVQTLEDSADEKDKPAKTTISVTADSDSDSAKSEPAKDSTDAAEPAKADETNKTDEDEEEEPAGGVKKIIKPLEAKPKKDIKELLAEEEAKEIGGGTSLGTSVSTEEDKPAGAPMVTPSEAAAAEGKPTEPDPGSIAL